MLQTLVLALAAQSAWGQSGPPSVARVPENVPSVVLPAVGFQPLRSRLPMRGFPGHGPQRLPPVTTTALPFVPGGGPAGPFSGNPVAANPIAGNAIPHPGAGRPLMAPEGYANPTVQPPQTSDPLPAATQPIQVVNTFVPTPPPTPTPTPTTTPATTPQVAPNAESDQEERGSAGPRTRPEFQLSTDPIVQPLEQNSVARAEPVDAARVVAMVGNQPILAGDLAGPINEALRQRQIEKITPEQHDMLIKQFLPQAIDAKLVYLEYLRKIPDDKVGEIQGKLRDAFDDHQLAKAMENAKVRTESELDAKLRELGSSVEKQRRQFGEMVLATQLLKDKVDEGIDVTREDLVRYYEAHRAEYYHPAAVRWEELAIRRDAFPTADAARQALSEMGRAVLQGQPWGEVARKGSQGLTAEEGGKHDWTEKASLVSQTLDEALFQLPVQQISSILEDKWGFHIVRVAERRDESYESFTSVQNKIREEIIKERSQQARTQFIEKLRKTTYVWTIFDGTPFQPEG